jgi:hypothetical protein
MKPLRKIDIPDYKIPMTSTEIFFGTKWTPRLGNAQVIKGPGDEVAFTENGGPYAPDLPYFSGTWVATTESMYGSSVNRDSMKVAINFTGTDAYIVATSRTKNPADVAQFTKVRVTIDSKQIAVENLGADTTINDQHQSVVTVRDPKLYHIVKGLDHKPHEMVLEFSANATDVMELFAFFFEHNA